MNSLQIVHQLSPCNGHCIIDPKTKYCKGCYRTIEEIIAWHSLSNEKKLEIIKLAEERKLNEKKKNSSRK